MTNGADLLSCLADQAASVLVLMGYSSLMSRVRQRREVVRAESVRLTQRLGVVKLPTRRRP